MAGSFSSFAKPSTASSYGIGTRLAPTTSNGTKTRKILELKGKATEEGRAVAPNASDEETPVPLAQTGESHLNHLKINQRLNTYRRYRSVLANFRDYFSSRRYLNEIGRGDFLEYGDFRASRVDSPVTLNSEITKIRAFLYWRVEFKGLKANPAAKITPRQVLQKSPEVFDDREIAARLRARATRAKHRQPSR